MECVQGSLDAWLQESALCVHSVPKWDLNNEGGGLQLQEAPLSTPSGAVLERKLVSVGTSQWPNGERIQECGFESNPRYRGYPVGQPVTQTCLVHLQLRLGTCDRPYSKNEGRQGPRDDHTPRPTVLSRGSPCCDPRAHGCSGRRVSAPFGMNPGPAGMRTGGEKALRLGLLGEGKKFYAKIKGIRVSSPRLEMSGGCQNSCSLSPWTLGLGP